MSLQHVREKPCANKPPRIKKAYRRKALELHPDRNFGNVEETTSLFAAVQSAYSILSDPQERAWYDSHHSAFSQAQDEYSTKTYEHNVRVTTTEDILKLLAKFDGRVSFSDSASDFYETIRGTFDTLAKEERLACEWEGLDPAFYPSFGHAGDNYEVVVRPFYVTWSSFATRKSFSWEDVYRYAEASDRRVRRMMERENKQAREEAIHKFNKIIRSLVGFVKKRDPRVKSNTQSETERQKILKDAAMAQAARSRAANQIKPTQTKVIPGWMNAEKPVEDDSGEEEQNLFNTRVECVVCKKTFKSENQYKVHEKSKKHIKVIQKVCREMKKDDEAFNLHENLDDSLFQFSEGEASRIIDQRTLTRDNKMAATESEPFVSPTEFKLPSSHSANSSERDNHGPTPLCGGVGSSSSTSSLLKASDDENFLRQSVDETPSREFEYSSETDIKTFNNDETIQRHATVYLAQKSENVKHLKVGKAKEKRVRKAARKAIADANSDIAVRKQCKHSIMFKH